MATSRNGYRVPLEPVDFSVLGPFQIRRAGVILPIPGQPERQLLATLLRYARQPVPLDVLVESVWPHDPPSSAERQVRADLALLRQLIGGPNGTIVIGASGRVTAEVEPERLDAGRFLGLLAAAEQAAGTGDLPVATRRVCDALHQWRGPALTGVYGRLRDEWVRELNEQRRYAVDLRFDIELRRGHHAQIVDELSDLVEHTPARAHLIGLLMLALHGSGQRDRALRLYERIRRSSVEGSTEDLGAALACVRDAVRDAQQPLAPRLHLRPQPPSVAGPAFA